MAKIAKDGLHHQTSNQETEKNTTKIEIETVNEINVKTAK
jgi:hypothetical protein